MSISSLSTPHTVLTNQNKVPTVPKSVTDVSQNWTAMQPDTIFNHNRTIRILDQYVKNDLFHMIVFISSPALTAFSRNAQLLCQVVCNYLNISPNEHECFWMLYAKFVEQKLNQKRSDVSNAIKTTFKGKLCSICLF